MQEAQRAGGRCERIIGAAGQGCQMHFLSLEILPGHGHIESQVKKGC